MIVDIGVVVEKIRFFIQDVSQEEKVDFFDAMDDLREEMGIVQDVYLSDILDYEIKRAALENVIDSVQENALSGKWLTVKQAAKRAGVSENAIRTRMEKNHLTVKRMLSKTSNVLADHVNQDQLDTLTFAPSYTKKQKNMPTQAETKRRRNLILSLLSDGREHRVGDIVAHVVKECNFSSNKAGKENTLSLINTMAKQGLFDWRSGGGDNKTPRSDDYIFIPSQISFSINR